jgi:hypothetical protein
MVNKNFYDDIKIHGRPDKIECVIRKPLEKTLAMEGTVDIISVAAGVDQDAAGITLDGVPLEHAVARSRLITIDSSNANGSETTIDGLTDPSVIYVNVDSTAVTDRHHIIRLPQTTSDVKNFTVKVVGNVSKKIRVLLRAFANSGITGGSVDGKAESVTDGGTPVWVSGYTFEHRGSVTLRSSVGNPGAVPPIPFPFPGVGSGDGWHTISSHNVVEEGHQPHAIVRASPPIAMALSALVIGASVDGVTVKAHDTILLSEQSSADENGIYRVSEAAAYPAIRMRELYTGAEAHATSVHVSEGTARANQTYKCTNALGSDEVGTDNLVYAVQGAGPFSARADVTQTSGINTAVTVNGTHGVISLVSGDSIGDDDRQDFIVNNTFVTASSVVILTGRFPDAEHFATMAAAPSSGAFSIGVMNQTQASANVGVGATVHYLVIN